MGTLTETPLEIAEAFFREHAGSSHNPATETAEEGRDRCARDLALAESTARAFGWCVEWQPDPDPIWDDDVDREHTDYDQFIAVLKNAEGEVIDSLGSVDLGPNQHPEFVPYGRVVATELMSQAITTIYFRKRRA